MLRMSGVTPLFPYKSSRVGQRKLFLVPFLLCPIYSEQTEHSTRHCSVFDKMDFSVFQVCSFTWGTGLFDIQRRLVTDWLGLLDPKHVTDEGSRARFPHFVYSLQNWQSPKYTLTLQTSVKFVCGPVFPVIIFRVYISQFAATIHIQRPRNMTSMQ